MLQPSLFDVVSFKYNSPFSFAYLEKPNTKHRSLTPGTHAHDSSAARISFRASLSIYAAAFSPATLHLVLAE